MVNVRTDRNQRSATSPPAFPPSGIHSSFSSNAPVWIWSSGHQKGSDGLPCWFGNLSNTITYESEFTEQLAVVDPGQVGIGREVDAVANKSHGAIAHQELTATGVRAAEGFH